MSYVWTRSSVRLIVWSELQKRTKKYGNRKLLIGSKIKNKLLPANSIDKQLGIFLKAWSLVDVY